MTLEQKHALVESLFRQWYPLLIHEGYRAGRSLELAEDAAQEAFLSLYRALLAGRTVERPLGWLLCVTNRYVARARRVETIHPQCKLEGATDVAGRADQAEEEWENSDLAKLLSVVSPREAEVILLRVQELTYKEIGRTLDISTNSVKTLLARGVGKMRAAFGRGSGQLTAIGHEYVFAKTLP